MKKLNLRLTVALELKTDADSVSDLEHELYLIARKIKAYPIDYRQLTEREFGRYKDGGERAWMDEKGGL